MMKTLTLITAFTVLCLFSSAQIQKDAVLLGGYISFGSNKTSTTPATNESKNNSAAFNVMVGKAFKQNKVFGIYGGYGKSKSEYYLTINTATETNTSYAAGIFYRLYKNLNKNFYFFGEISTGFNGTKNVIQNHQPDTKNSSITNRVALGISPGISYQVSNKLQLEVLMPQFAGLQYGTTKNTANNGSVSKSSGFNFSTNLNTSLLNSLALGFKFIL